MERSKSPAPTKKAQKTMSFFDALKEVVAGKKIQRLEWENKEIYGFLNEELLSLHKADNKNYQWIVNDGDLNATDWIIL